MKLVRFWLPVIVWMVVIFIFSSRERVEVSPLGVVNFLFFKTLHIIEYAVLYVVIFRAVKNSFIGKKIRFFLVVAFILTILYAVSDELHQIFVPTREGRARDVIIDTIGAGFAWYAIKILLPKAPRKLKELAKSWQIR